MNTLILDLTDLINNHLTTLEDIFLNHQNHDQTKNIKKAVVKQDWKAILYFFQRYEYAGHMYYEAYKGACELGKVDLMKLFILNTEPADWSWETKKYLAKGRHYELLDQQDFDKKEYCPILEGLVLADDLEMIISNKYGTIQDHICNMHAGKILYKATKHNRSKILNFLAHHINLTKQDLLEGWIKRGEQITMNDLEDIEIGIYMIHDLAQYGHYDLIEELVLNSKDGVLTPSSYIEGLVEGGWYDQLNRYLAKIDRSRIREADIRIMLVDASLLVDNLELFIENYNPEDQYYSILVMKVVEHCCFKILKYLLEISKQDIYNEDYEQWFPKKIIDPRIRKMLQAEVDKGRKIADLLD